MRTVRFSFTHSANSLSPAEQTNMAVGMRQTEEVDKVTDCHLPGPRRNVRRRYAGAQMSQCREVPVPKRSAPRGGAQMVAPKRRPRNVTYRFHHCNSSPESSIFHQLQSRPLLGPNDQGPTHCFLDPGRLGPPTFRPGLTHPLY